MLTPAEFMAYATPVIVLISQEVRAYIAKRAMERITENQTKELNQAGLARAEVLQSTTLDTASKLAVHTSETTSAIAGEVAEIHEIVNGNTTALKNRIAELEGQLATANRHS